MLLQRWEAKICQKEKSPQPGIELTTTRSRVRHTHHWATRARHMIGKEKMPVTNKFNLFITPETKGPNYLPGCKILVTSISSFLIMKTPIKRQIHIILTLYLICQFSAHPFQQQIKTWCQKYGQMGIQLPDWVENIVGKGEIACYKQFLLFPRLQKLSVVYASKWVSME